MDSCGSAGIIAPGVLVRDMPSKGSARMSAAIVGYAGDFFLRGSCCAASCAGMAYFLVHAEFYIAGLLPAIFFHRAARTLGKIWRTCVWTKDPSISQPLG